MSRRFTNTVRTLALLLGLSVSGAVLAQEFAEGRLLVKAAAGLKADKFDKILKQIEKKARVKRKLRGTSVSMVEVPPKAEKRIAKLLAKNPHIAFVELDELVKPDVIPNDPRYGDQWHLPKMGAEGAWSVTTGNNIIVAVLDTGVNPNHADLSGQVLPGYNTVSGNSDTADINNHGTWVAGVIAAKMNNATGVASVAPGAKILPVRISDRSDGVAYYSDMVEGITWAADNGARVVNISYGGAGSSSVANAGSYLMGKGGVLVMAAGNSNADNGYINHASIYVAAATNKSDAKASYSNYGSFIDISAPGSGILTTSRNGGYSSVSGTSFASPNTAAVAALIMAANPNLQPTDVLAVISNSSVDLGTAGWDPQFGYGRVNAHAAAVMADSSEASDTAAPQVTILDPTGAETVNGLVSVTVEAVDNFGVTEVELWAGTQPVAAEPTSIGNYKYVFTWDSTTVSDGNHQLVARARDAAGNTGVASAVTVNVGNASNDDTIAPTVQITSPGNGTGGTRSVFLAAQASDNVSVTQVSIYADGKLRCAGTTSTSCSWNIRKVSPGPKTITATAQDAAGNQSSTSVSFTVEGSSGGGGKGGGKGRKK